MNTTEKPVVTKRSFSNPPFRIFSVRNVRRMLMGAAILVTLVALFYTEENWRGKRAWEQFKQEAAARGISMDWEVACVPPAVPDDQNFFKAPHMQDWFVGRGQNDFDRRLDSNHLYEWLYQHSLVPCVDVTIMPTTTKVAAGSADLVLDYHALQLSLADSKPSASASKPASGSKELRVRVEADVTEKLSQLIKQKLTEYHPKEFTTAVNEIQLFPLGTEQLEPIAPLRIVVRTESQPSENEIKEFLPPNASQSKAGGYFISLGNGTYRTPLVSAPPWVRAADYLAWSDGYAEDFKAISVALDRPYARMDGNYESPVHFPIPNFICMRVCAQTLAIRAQCFLLLNQPEAALHELTLLHRMSRLLEARPTGKPMTLIAAMINVAIKGLYVSTIGDGFRLKAWHEPQLAALQQQLAETELMSHVQHAMLFESQTPGRLVDISTSKELADQFYDGSMRLSFWEKMKNRSYMEMVLLPRGWLYQSAAIRGRFDQSMLADIDPDKQLIDPEKLGTGTVELERSFDQHPFTSYFAALMIPNYLHAMETCGKNQTLVNEALIACALERYRFAHGQYPESLDALMPQYLDKLPHDLIGGAPLKYRKEGEKFVLYSIGWNAKDDGGVPSPEVKNSGSQRYLEDLTKNDWVWPYQEPMKQ